MLNHELIEENIKKITGSQYVVEQFQKLLQENKKLKSDIAILNLQVTQTREINNTWCKLMKLQNQELRNLEAQLKN